MVAVVLLIQLCVQLLVQFFLLTTNAHAEFFVHSWEDRFPKSSITAGLDSSYFYTNSNFSNTGSVISPPGLTSYAKLEMDLNVNVKVTDSLSTFGRLSWSYINTQSSSNGGTGFGLGDQTLGLVFRILGTNPDDSFVIDLQAQVDLPAYSNATSLTNGTPYLGDGSMDATGGIFSTLIIKEGKKFRLEALLGAGYTYRSDGFSSAIPWSGHLRLSPQREGLGVDLLLDGFLSMQNDTSFNYGTAHANLVSGGGYITGAIDPTLIQVGVKSSYGFPSGTQLSVAGKFNLTGQNVPAGYLLAGGVEIPFGKTKRSHIEKQIRSLTPVEPDPATNSQPTFNTYSMTGKIVKTNNRLNLVKINKGSQDGIEAGQIFDIFNIKLTTQDGEVIARAQVTQMKVDEAVLEVTEFYKEMPIEEGFIVKRLIH